MHLKEGTEEENERDETAEATERNPNLGHLKLTFLSQLPLCSYHTL